MAGKGTTDPGYINRNCQINLGPTDPTRSGSDHNAYVYVLHCPKCGTNYGANGTDVHHRKCPYCQGGVAGLPLEGDETDWRPDSAPDCSLD